MHPSLEPFHSLIRRWFQECLGEPTDIQQRAWPRIAAGANVLLTAPTGSGKTLTAFLWALDRLLTGAWRPGAVRVLYVSPLRALNTDIRRNLERPLAELATTFREAGEHAPEIRAMTRSGDTTQGERRQMQRRPPEILITTPESLNILLTSQGGRRLMGGIETVILDEIHAVAASKRGTHLITAVDRLVPLVEAGRGEDFQRIALSATVRPLERIADFVGGYRLGPGGSYEKRRIETVRSRAEKTYEISVRFPEEASMELEGDSLWQVLAREFHRVARRNRSTLFFANSRRMTEKATRFLNAESQGGELAYSHHGSLSREVRAVVEERLKKGQLAAIVATNSLELGIDIGALDEVVLIQSPRAISSAIQRIGRAGHGVGETSRGLLFPTHGRDFLDAAVVARAVVEQEVEPMTPVTGPLDVLAQVILSMVAAEPWRVEDLHARLRTSYPYRHLSRRQLDLVLDMLTGRYAESRIRELRPRLLYDRVEDRLEARPGLARLLYMSGGTIADRGYFTLRLLESNARLGELDEEFVWERSAGDTFTLGAQGWRVQRITHNDVLVTPARGATAMPPFWRADAQDRGSFLTERTAHFLGRIESGLAGRELPELLGREHHMEERAAAELVDYLRRQKAATGRLPSRHLLVIEHIRGRGGGEEHPVVLHTFWGGTVNRPFALALAAAWEERFGQPLEVFQSDDNLLVKLPAAFPAADLFSLVHPDRLEDLLRFKLEKTGFFGARFRLAASTALLLPRSGFRQRLPLWLNRQRAKKLLEAVADYDDFPVLAEAWRTCLQDEMELEVLRRRLGEVTRGEIQLHEVSTEGPSPFAAQLFWQQTNQLMYEDDTPERGGASRLRPDLLEELVHASHLRPRIPPDLALRFRLKVQRLAEGYAPRGVSELVEWVGERLLLPEAEWAELLAAVARDHGPEAGEGEKEELWDELAARLVAVRPDPEHPGLLVSIDRLPTLAHALGLDPAGLELHHPRDWHLPATAAARERLDILLDPPSSSPLPSGPEAASPNAESTSELGDGEPEEERMALLTLLVGEWLRYHGPLAEGTIASVWGLAKAEERDVTESLRQARQVVVDPLTRGAEAPEVVDAENLEILLRWLRIEARPSFEARPLAELPLFLALQQGLTPRGSSLEDLQDRLEPLFGYPAPARLWETEILPSRLEPYYPAWLDALLRETELRWFGCGKERVTFGFEGDQDLWRPEEAAAAEEAEEDAGRAASLFPPTRGKYELAELAEHAGLPAAELAERLWRLAWAGEVSTDSFQAVRKGVERRFRPVAEAAPARPARPSRRASFDRWRSGRPLQGSWFPLEEGEAPADALDREELAKDRARVLLGRYGILFRELLARELPAMSWSRVFRALRLMELSGEVLAGHFFRGVPGLQFVTHAAFRRLGEGLPGDAIYHLSAADPASLAGIAIDELKASLPPRRATTRLVYHGTELVFTARRGGKELEVAVEPEHPHLGDYLGALKLPLAREVQPRSHLTVETINGEGAAASPYCEPLGRIFRLTREPGGIRLWKRY